MGILSDPGKVFARARDEREEKRKERAQRVKKRCSEAEWKLRVDLAAAYRIAAMEGMDDTINNHFTVRIPDTHPHQFLINAFGEGFDEITASSLVKIDTNGNVIDPGSQGGAVNRAGFVIHSAIHNARDDAVAVMHTHEENITAVSTRELLPISQTALVTGEITYHEYEGVAVSLAERETLKRDLGTTSSVMILRNHGVLTLGRSVAVAFARLFYVTKAAKIQVKASSLLRAGGQLHMPSKSVIEETSGPRSLDTEGVPTIKRDSVMQYADAVFRQFRRRLDRKNPGYNDCP